VEEFSSAAGSAEGFWLCLCKSWANSPALGMVEMDICTVAGKKVYCLVENVYGIDV